MSVYGVVGTLQKKPERKGVKTSFYLDSDLVERLRNCAWYERTNASQIVSKLVSEYLAGKRIPKRPREEE